MTATPFSTVVIDRWSGAARIGVWGAAISLILLALVPFYASDGMTGRLTALCIYVMLAAMWNALAGYGGLVSIGQQMFFGLGAYITIRIANLGLDPFLAIVLSGLVVAAIAWPVSLFMLRLRGGEFAIGMWVLSSITHLLVNLDPLIQGETGTSLISMNAYDADTRRAAVFWLALAAMALVLGLLFVLLRSRMGLAVQAIRDSEEAAGSLGVDPVRTKRVLFVLAAFGIGLAGAIWLASATSFQPKTYFSVQWTAYMIFMVLVGGIGRFEGAVLGAILFFLIETWFAATGVWYLIGLGATAIVFSLFLPKGIWGALNLRLLPIGYHVNGNR
jgi:branched-chain amino acid transport system permease protein